MHLIIFSYFINYLVYQENILMRYSERFRQQIIPQWKSCYIQYDFLKKIVKVLRDTVRERLELQELLQHGTKHEIKVQQSISILNIQIPEDEKTIISQNYDYFYETSNRVNLKFQQIFEQNIKLLGDFTSLKFQQIKSNYEMCCKFSFSVTEKDKKNMDMTFKGYLENLFVESIYLARMVQTNIEAQRRILTKHKLYANGIFQTSEPFVENTIKVNECHILRRSIERLYFKTINKSKQQKRYRLRKLAQQMNIKPIQSLAIGLLLGAVITVIIFMCIILARASITLQSDPIFNMDFPLWRGIALILFNIWIWGVNLHFFQKYGINFRTVLENRQNQSPHSTDLFRIAGIFSIIFVTCFTIYSLQIADIVETGVLAPQWLALFVWGSFILFLINPLPIFYSDGRIFSIKIIIKVLFSFYIVSFPAVWGTAQALSLLNVFQDLFYTVCYYTHLQLPFPEEEAVQNNICKSPAVLAKFIYTIIIYFLRTSQCLRLGYTERKIQYLNAFKFLLALLTAVLAYLWKDVKNDNIFPAWLTFAIISTIFSFLWQVMIGWDLFHKKSKNFFLRDQLLYPKQYYYVWIIINFFLRLSWTLNISTNIISNWIGSPEVFSLTFALLEIFRRGIWTLLRCQVQQIKNNLALSTAPKQQTKFHEELNEYVQKHKQKLNSISIQSLFETQKQILRMNESPIRDIKGQKKQIIERLEQKVRQSKEELKKIEHEQQVVKEKIKILLRDIY